MRSQKSSLRRKHFNRHLRSEHKREAEGTAHPKAVRLKHDGPAPGIAGASVGRCGEWGEGRVVGGELKSGDQRPHCHIV